MRGAKAKRLRRQAEEQTVGAPSRRLILGGHKTGSRQGGWINHPDTTRAVYRNLKRMNR